MYKNGNLNEIATWIYIAAYDMSHLYWYVNENCLQHCALQKAGCNYSADEYNHTMDDKSRVRFLRPGEIRRILRKSSNIMAGCGDIPGYIHWRREQKDETTKKNWKVCREKHVVGAAAAKLKLARRKIRS